MMNLGQNRTTAWSGFCMALLTLVMAGCIQAPFKEPVRLGALVDDSLMDGTTSGTMKGGMLTDEGYMPMSSGMLMYDLPGMSQGTISFDVSGLNRIDDESIFVTLFEPARFDFPTPYVTMNPYKITLSAKPYSESPDSTFDWLWSSKDFPTASTMETIYSDTMPENNTYVGTVSSGEVALFPSETHSITITWANGVARLYVDGDQVARHMFRPVTFTPSALRVVFGQSPGAAPLSYNDLVFSNIEIDYPGA